MKIKLLFVSMLISLSVAAQDDLMNLLGDDSENQTTEVAYTFKSTRIINSHSIERMKAHQLDFRINHRFGELNSGAYDLWGMDNAKVSLDLGYGITNWMMIGLRRSTEGKTYDGSFKFTLFRQTEGAKVFPVAISYYTNVAINTLKNSDPNYAFQHRLSFTNQLLVARKISESISLQVMPTFVHRNEVNFNEENDVIAVGVGGRYKFTRRVALMGEYFLANHTAGSNGVYYNPLSLGVDIETGGHVFQLFVSNSRNMEESSFISQTTGSWGDGGLYFGFNISRVFAIGHAKEK